MNNTDRAADARIQKIILWKLHRNTITKHYQNDKNYQG
jgi:hypothetical protein